MKNNSTYSKLLIAVFCMVFAGTSYAQKQPNIQEVGRWLPAAYKIDGKLSEWNGLLEAKNKATKIEYTLANNEQALYLAVRSEDIVVSSKILAGGISLIVNPEGQKNIAGAPVIISPIRNLYYQDTDPFGNGIGIVPLLMDSTRLKNEVQQIQLKEIGIANLKGIKEPTLSVYNEEGVRTKIAYLNGALIYELLVPIELLGLPASASFDYSIKLNGPKLIPGKPGEPAAPTPKPGSVQAEVRATTDFRGTYTLAKDDN